MSDYIVSVDLPIYEAQSEEDAIAKFREAVQTVEAAVFTVEENEE